MAMMQDAADQLGESQESGQSDAADDNASEKSSSDSFFIPKDIVGGKTYKKGDKITLEVMGEDEDGDLEVCVPGANSTNWRDDLKATMSDQGDSQA